LPIIYRPVRQYMTPQNTSINPSIDNDCSLIIDGLNCVGYSFRTYDFDNNLIYPVSLNRQTISTLNDGDTLPIPIPASTLTAGNDYKWQVVLYGNDLTVSSINTTTDVLTVTNHNLNTGDIIYIQSLGTIPAGLSAFTRYFIRKLSSNTISLYEAFEGSKIDSGRIDITSAGSGTITISNISISEQIPFSVYDVSTLTLTGTTITSQSYEFIPVHVQNQNLLIDYFNAYLYEDDEITLIEESETQYSSDVRWEFSQGLRSGTAVKVKFTAVDMLGQEMDTGFISFDILYDIPNITASPTATNNYFSSSITSEWSGIIQNTAIVTGGFSYTANFMETGNYGLNLDVGSILEIENLNIEEEQIFGFVWYPDSISHTGEICKLENTITSDYLLIGYNGVSFYIEINQIQNTYSAKPLVSNQVYLLVIQGTQLYVIDFITV